VTIGANDRWWIVWRDANNKYAHALFLDMHANASNGVAMKKPIAISHLRENLVCMELAEPDQVTWLKFPKKLAVEFRDILMAA
jgi:hypothetical protein